MQVWFAKGTHCTELFLQGTFQYCSIHLDDHNSRKRTVPCFAPVTLRDRTSPPSSLRGACARAGAGRGPSVRTPTCRTEGDTRFQSGVSLHWRVCICELCGAGTLQQPRPSVCATTSQSKYVMRLKTGCSWWCLMLLECWCTRAVVVMAADLCIWGIFVSGASCRVITLRCCSCECILCAQWPMTARDGN